MLNRIENLLSGAAVNSYTETNDILSRKEAAAFLGICLTTLDRLDIPRVRLRHRVVFKRDVLHKWLDEQSCGKKRGKKL